MIPLQMATKMYKQGEQSLQEAQVLKETAESQLASVRSQQVTLQKREKHLTQVRFKLIFSCQSLLMFCFFEGEIELCEGEEGANSEFSWHAR